MILSFETSVVSWQSLAEWARQEADFYTAQREGRVLGGFDVSGKKLGRVQSTARFKRIGMRDPVCNFVRCLLGFMQPRLGAPSRVRRIQRTVWYTRSKSARQTRLNGRSRSELESWITPRSQFSKVYAGL